MMRGNESKQVSTGGKTPEKARRQATGNVPIRGAAISNASGDCGQNKNTMGHGERCAEAKHHMGSK